MKKVPDFWWDFADNARCVIVESDIEKHPVVARFDVPDDAPHAEAQISAAQQLIADLNAGRVSLKQLAVA